MPESPTKADEGVTERRSSGYKSWKKKYRKMRIVFEQKMQQGEELHKQEEKASATVKRLAIENDRLLDLLLEVNNSPQIPPERRIDLSLEPPSDPKAPVLPLDRKRPDASAHKDGALKRLEHLLSEVPHSSYSAARDARPSYMADLVAIDDEAPRPASFLTADDIDNYIYAIDTALDPDTHLPTLAPRAHPELHPVPSWHVKNPTSVTSWLRKNKPKIFLQEAEMSLMELPDDPHAKTRVTNGRKSRGGGGPRGERGGKPGPKGKRGSAVARLAADRGSGSAGKDSGGAEGGGGGDWDASMDEDPDFGATPAGRGKRKRDEDGGYRPGGSSSRPSKKKRKSEIDGTPSARRSKKEAAAAAAASSNRDD
ncbi:hypothetical protein HIM_06754 [Hirsutella minnesotensis 3608]|uniref:IEC3 subunit of the Ino80 complex, chromatin re-modelling-domain-containing protein n=1 Tax=Hirsutella minnesotensis 3608 TaxID=1043627 RepID=A0A0F7ZIM8_9HYPO|nr:hypothetical protein HIM_06754 [Hirsutella minnesotensis 3608]